MACKRSTVSDALDRILNLRSDDSGDELTPASMKLLIAVIAILTMKKVIVHRHAKGKR